MVVRTRVAIEVHFHKKRKYVPHPAAIASRNGAGSCRSKQLTEKDTIVLADFTNTTGDSVFDDAMKQALSVSLRQSPYLNGLETPFGCGYAALCTTPATWAE